MGFTNIQIRELYSLGPYRVGWKVYPIIFEGEKYIVELRCAGLGFLLYPTDANVVAKCFKYEDKKRLFGGYKGKLVFKRDVTSCIKGKDSALNIWNLTPDALKFFMSRILEEIFRFWDDDSSNKLEQNAKCKFCEQLESRDYLIPARNRMDTDNLCQCLSWGRIDGSVETGPWATIYCPENCGGCADDNEHFGLFTFENRIGFSYHFKSKNLRIDRNSQMLTINFCPWCGKPLSEEIVPFEKSCINFEMGSVMIEK